MSHKSRRRFEQNTTVPAGGDGQSARCSRVFYRPVDCPIKLDGTPPAGTNRWFSEQVTRIEINEQVYVRKYGHDKSFCAQDATMGIISWDGTLTTMVQCNSRPFSFHAGQILWLAVYPLGTGRANAKIEGYAVIERAPTTMNLENGEPVSRSYTYCSKGWWNIPEGVSGTFDCCNCCEGHGGGGGDGSGGDGSGSDGSGSGGGGSMAVVETEVAHAPVTAYQWNGTAWAVVYDECKGEFVQGPAPTAPGTYAGELKFVAGIIGT